MQSSLEKLVETHKSQLNELTSDYEVRIAEKTQTLTKHRLYYKEKCQELLYEVLARQPS